MSKASQQEMDMAVLMRRPEFKRFLFRSIQTSGLFQSSTNGSDGRDLNFHEGRRSMGLELLRDAENALDARMRTPECLLTLNSIIREESQKPSEKPSEQTKNRHSELDED